MANPLKNKSCLLLFLHHLRLMTQTGQGIRMRRIRTKACVFDDGVGGDDACDCRVCGLECGGTNDNGDGATLPFCRCIPARYGAHGPCFAAMIPIPTADGDVSPCLSEPENYRSFDSCTSQAFKTRIPSKLLNVRCWMWKISKESI